MRIRDAEVILQCYNPADLDAAGKGICKGMVMMFILAAARVLDYRRWLPSDLKAGNFVDPTRRGGFYMGAAALHVVGTKMAADLRHRIGDPYKNELAVVPEMYKACDLYAVATTEGYEYLNGGAALVAAVLRGVDGGLSAFHISLRRAEGGHSIGVWHTGRNNFFLFDPNSGLVELQGRARFAEAVRGGFERVTPEQRAHGTFDGSLAEYGVMCCWGVTREIPTFGLPPPPAPPGASTSSSSGTKHH